MTENEKTLIDTNILVYAYDKSEGEKHKICKGLVAECFSGKRDFYISNQILAEFSFVTLNKITNKLSLEEVKGTVEEINICESWHKIAYSNVTVEKSLGQNNLAFWDSLIAETMIENGIFTIYTENEKDFKKKVELKVINPLK